MFGSILEPLTATRQLLIDGLIAAIIFAVLVAVLSETIKSGLQGGLRARMFREWWDRITGTGAWHDGISDRDIESFTRTWSQLGISPAAGPITGLGDMTGVREFKTSAFRACTLPNELFMRKIENMARAILERPSQRPDLFIALTNGAAADDQLLVMRLDEVMNYPDSVQSTSQSTSPDDTRSLPEPQTLPSKLLAAQERVASALDRNLDDLQLLFAREWSALMYSASLMIGIVVSLLVAVLVNGFSSIGYLVTLGIIGAIAGLLSAVVRDRTSSFFDERRQ